jgi:DNA-binding GntR family transcriptional regulator
MQGAGLTAEVYRSLRAAIITGKLRPGERIVEADLGRQFGVSKSPGREALKTLQHEGLVDAIPRRGYVVTPITVKQVQDVMHLRLVLEREVAAEAARRATPAQIEELRRLVGTPYLPGRSETYARFLGQNKVFHMALARITGNARLLEVLGRLLDDLERLFHLGLDVSDRSQLLIGEHEELVDAIAARDAERAVRVTEAQIERARQMIIDGILSGGLAVHAG